MTRPDGKRSNSLPAQVAVVAGIVTAQAVFLVPAVVVARDIGALQRSPYELWLLHVIQHTWNGPTAIVGDLVLVAIVALVTYGVVGAWQRRRNAGV